jgi:hypothetical protein
MFGSLTPPPAAVRSPVATISTTAVIHGVAPERVAFVDAHADTADDVPCTAICLDEAPDAVTRLVIPLGAGDSETAVLGDDIMPSTIELSPAMRADSDDGTVFVVRIAFCAKIGVDVPAPAVDLAPFLRSSMCT